MRKPIITLGTLLFVVVASVTINAEPRLEHDPNIYHFGHIGVDYTVFYNYQMKNTGDQPVKILSASANCDCSRVSLMDSVIAPGDSTRIRLIFNTRNYFGPTEQSFSVRTDMTSNPEWKVYYVSNVGKWIAGIKPDPISLFFLPGQKPKPVVVDNTQFDRLEARLIDQADSSYSVTFESDSAGKGDRIELVVAPDKSLARGTYESSFRVEVAAEGLEDPVILTIPVKIVVY